MKTLKCADVGAVPDCDHAVTGETNQECIDKAFAHAATDHKEIVEKMTDEDKQNIVAKMNEILDKQE